MPEANIITSLLLYGTALVPRVKHRVYASYQGKYLRPLSRAVYQLAIIYLGPRVHLFEPGSGAGGLQMSPLWMDG